MEELEGVVLLHLPQHEVETVADCVSLCGQELIGVDALQCRAAGDTRRHTAYLFEDMVRLFPHAVLLARSDTRVNAVRHEEHLTFHVGVGLAELVDHAYEDSGRVEGLLLLFIRADDIVGSGEQWHKTVL